MQTRKSYRQEKDAFDFTGGVLDFRSTLHHIMTYQNPGAEREIVKTGSFGLRLVAIEFLLGLVLQLVVHLLLAVFVL